FPRHLPFALGPEPDWEREPRAPVAFALAGRCAPPIRIATAPDGSFLALDGGLYGDDGVAPTPDALLDRCLQAGEQALKDIAFTGFLAYWNQSARRLTLMRDDVGACPGYFARYHGGLAFASELSTL